MGWRLNNVLDRIRDAANAAAPHRDKTSDGTIGDLAHRSRSSDHNPDANGIVNALDIDHDPNAGMDAHAWADTARLAARDGRAPWLKYVISEGKIASSRNDWAWRGYDGSNFHGLHAHFSAWAAQENFAGPLPFGTEPAPPPLPEKDDNMSSAAHIRWDGKDHYFALDGAGDIRHLFGLYTDEPWHADFLSQFGRNGKVSHGLQVFVLPNGDLQVMVAREGGGTHHWYLSPGPSGRWRYELI